MLSDDAGNAESDSAKSSKKSKAESSAGSSQEARAKEPLVKHICRAGQGSLPPQPLPLELSCKLSPSQNPSNEAAAMFIADNIDILEKILLYLPSKSLLRFQSVSKIWLSIISNPVFRRLWFYRRRTSSSVAATEALFLFGWKFDKTPEELNFVSLSDGYVNSMAKIVYHLNNFFDNGKILDFHSCNGLLALVFKLDDYDDHREFVVFNPTTRQHKLIPQPNDSQLSGSRLFDPQIDDPYYEDFRTEVRRRFEALNIVFDPSKSDYYKLVCVWRDNYEGFLDRYGFSVYASETGIWRQATDTLAMDLPVTYFGNGVLWNCDLHWVSDWKNTICFDLDKECLREMPSLPVEFGKSDFWYFGEYNGSLYVIEVNNPSGLLFDVFEMARDYSKWVLKYLIDLAPLECLYPSMVDEYCDPLDDWRCRFGMPFFLEDEKVKKASLVISLQGKLILYNTNDAVVTELAEVGPIDFGYSWRSQFYQWKDAYRHMETLVHV